MTQLEDMAKGRLPSPSPSVLPEEMPHPVGLTSVETNKTAVVAAEFSCTLAVCPDAIVMNLLSDSSPRAVALTLPLSLVTALASMTIAIAVARPIATLLRSFVVKFLLLFVFASLCGMAATMTVVRACKHLEGCGRYPLG